MDGAYQSEGGKFSNFPFRHSIVNAHSMRMNTLRRMIMKIKTNVKAGKVQVHDISIV